VPQKVETHLIVLRDGLPVVHEEDFERVWHGESHLRPSRPIVVIPPPFRTAPAFLTSPSPHLCPTSRSGSFRGRGASRSGRRLRLGKVLLKGEVGLIEFKKACRRDPFVPARGREQVRKKSWWQRAKVGGTRTFASSLCSAQSDGARRCLVLCSFRPKLRI